MSKLTNKERTFLAAAAAGNFKLMKNYIRENLNVDVKDSYEHTALILAAGRGQHAVVAILLKAGADPNACSKNGDTALIQAATKGCEVTVELLLNACAEVDAQDDFGYTALAWAAYTNRRKVVNLLIGAKANPMLKNHNDAIAVDLIISRSLRKQVQAYTDEWFFSRKKAKLKAMESVTRTIDSDVELS